MEIVGTGNSFGKQIVILLFVSCILVMSAVAKAKSLVPDKTIDRKKTDTSVIAEINAQLNDKSLNKGLCFPLSTKRFYQKRAFTPVWTVEQKDQNKTWAAMLLIDCVLQFGLRHEDYHPGELQYTTLHTILEQPGKISNKKKARFEIVLTDALLSFMNNLHFGKLNPYYPASKIDRETINGFNTEETLTNALKQSAFMDAIVKVQPANRDYTVFQYQLHLIKGVYEGDCYETPEADIRKIAVNMERLRWAAINDSAYIQINIPTYTLKLVLPDTTFNFKIIVGAPATPTPLTAILLTGFTTSQSTQKVNAGNGDRSVAGSLSSKQAPINQRKNDNIYFIGSSTAVALQGTSDKSLFRKQKRASSNGGIIVERGGELAKLLLKIAGNESDVKSMSRALLNREIKFIQFKSPVPVKVTYITAAIGDGGIVKYNDIYNLDSKVENLLYQLKPRHRTK
ncbi:hypothetical protein [Mucilaginibacter rubeus]|uniref:L,D-transpeptidase scaffold domain-containing protein n=1 Tax=Mucilaginibacter rubeus TaxID=2027860 RepID=A0A5C1HZX4_9SPHI|nr:hypothetical protein [Mucilaginibacter rubeus]QEM10650.1 hypothetical protein DEO27_011665 [Mucilaginibacter rubeus]